ncbi:hypothetical protein K435DRAFT_793309 [Dendrothele bispora CBS 962.96]|uniref:Uncharacterized protein n=1 Tax=Dendrothele bispora (strain CBS 962.96) TaxID=1314807 RepID=A0A4S8MGZ6_DENBC|nr:hypothetical protein K435DRAFT_793309 [Dendrothele bispora CBS 962.96]
MKATWSEKQSIAPVLLARNFTLGNSQSRAFILVDFPCQTLDLQCCLPDSPGVDPASMQSPNRLGTSTHCLAVYDALNSKTCHYIMYTVAHMRYQAQEIMACSALGGDLLCGGLGYKSGSTMLKGLHKTAEEHYKKGGSIDSVSGKDKDKNGNENNLDGNGSSLGLGSRTVSGFEKSYDSGLIRAERTVGEIEEKVKRGTGSDLVKVPARNSWVVGCMMRRKRKSDKKLVKSKVILNETKEGSVSSCITIGPLCSSFYKC